MTAAWTSGGPVGGTGRPARGAAGDGPQSSTEGPPGCPGPVRRGGGLLRALRRRRVRHPGRSPGYATRTAPTTTNGANDAALMSPRPLGDTTEVRGSAARLALSSTRCARARRRSPRRGQSPGEACLTVYRVRSNGTLRGEPAGGTPRCGAGRASRAGAPGRRADPGRDVRARRPRTATRRAAARRAGPAVGEALRLGTRRGRAARP